MSFHRRFASIALLLAIAPACGGASPETPAAPEPATTATAPVAPSVPPPTDSGADADADASKAQCNTLMNVATDVPIISQAADPPPATGGEIADGTYVVTNAYVYTGSGGALGPTGKTVRMTVSIAGNVSESVFDGVTRTATMTTSGGQVEVTTTCPGNGSETFSYSATPSSFTIYLLDSAGTRVYFLTKL